MPAADTRQEFAPPHTPGMLRALVLALLAHAALIGVLAIGVAWKRELPPATFEAELWSTIPQEAAPPPPEEVLPEPETPPPPEAKPTPEPPPPPVVKQAAPDAPSKADIALAKEKERLIEEQKAKELQAKQALERKAQEKRQQEQAAKDKAEKERAAQAKLKEEKDKLAKDKAAREAKEKIEKAQKTEAANKAKAAEAAKQKAEAKRAEQERQQQLNRLTGLAGTAGSGTPGSAGTAAKSSGPGANYSGRIQAAVKPNITFTDTIVGNPKTEIEVSLSSTGEILSKRLIKRSGNKAWDDAAENAIDKTRKLPLDDGRVWSPMVIVISPQTLVGQ